MGCSGEASDKQLKPWKGLELCAPNADKDGKVGDRKFAAMNLGADHELAVAKMIIQL